MHHEIKAHEIVVLHRHMGRVPKLSILVKQFGLGLDRFDNFAMFIQPLANRPCELKFPDYFGFPDKSELCRECIKHGITFIKRLYDSSIWRVTCRTHTLTTPARGRDADAFNVSFSLPAPGLFSSRQVDCV
jgi:hypothetical protein